MVYRPRARRVALLGARVQLAITIADVVDVSRTGVRIRASYEWRAGSEWPLVLEITGGGTGATDWTRGALRAGGRLASQWRSAAETISARIHIRRSVNGSGSGP